jgi:hypothetical protein
VSRILIAGNAEIGGMAFVAFPLTPALSHRERVNGSPFLLKIDDGIC